MRDFEIDWWPKRLVYAPGSVAQLPKLIASLGRRKALIVCGKSIAASQDFSRVKETLGELFAGVFPHVEMHAPLPSIKRGAAYAREVDADVIVSIGGGSAIDSGKGVSLMHRVGDKFLDYGLQAGPGAPAPEPMPELDLAHIAIPTTTGSGSEITPTCGFRDPVLGHKRIFRNTRLIPDIAVHDPEMTTGTPEILTACSSMTAVARCVEALYSVRRNPFRTGLALHGLQMLVRGLPRCIAAPHDLDARAECLVGSAMSAIAANVNTSAVHAIGHVVGGKYGLQHGVAHTILLASAMRLMLPLISDEQKTLLSVLGEKADGLTADEAGRRAAALMEQFVNRLPLAHKLRDVGVERDVLTGVAEHAGHDPILLSSGADVSSERILAMLEEAY